MDDYWIWDPSVIRSEDGMFCMFASRWLKSIPFHPGWLTNSQVILAVSDRADGPYHFKQDILPQRGAEFWDGRMTHSARVVRWKDHYVLYYTGITHPLSGVTPGEPLSKKDPRVIASRAGKRLGMAVSKTPYGPWQRSDEPILPTKAGTFYSYLTSNPAPCVCPDGSLLLVFKSRRHEGNTYGPMFLGAARAENLWGPYRVLGQINLGGELEDPFVWHDGSRYRMIAKDMTGTLCGEYHAGISAQSDDGLNWNLCQPPKAYSRTVEWDDGSKTELGSLERPSVFFQDGRATHLFGAVADGPGGFEHALHTWNVAIPLC